jgi:hypothetical protein
MKKKLIVGLCIAPFALYGLFSLAVRPSNDRNWSVDQVILPTAEFTGNQVTIRNVRNFSYASTTSYTPNYYDKTYNLDDIESLWYVVEPFSKGGNLAHTFLSFGFKGDQYISVSVEIRKEKGEAFSPLKGLLRQYEIMYVIADERDVIQLRSNHRKDKVFVYPVRATKEATRDIFVDMLKRANDLAQKPEFYNTLTNTCTTNIMVHVNNVIPQKIPFNITILVPGQSDHFAYDLGLIETDLTFADARKKFLINERAREYADSPDFSNKIRD